MKRRPRILLADDHLMLLDAFKSLLQPYCEIVGTATNGRALIELSLATQPELIILDIFMPGLNGLDACVQIRAKQPNIKFIFLTVNEDPYLAAEAIGAGASGFLLKHSASSEMILAIESAMVNKIYITPLITKDKPLNVFVDDATSLAKESLTSRQREVISLLAEGKKMKEVARMLNVTTRTIAFHKYSIMDRLGLKTSAELVQYAIEHQLLTPRM
jgi:DNA-binding NarL/FixJ family response regulator